MLLLNGRVPKGKDRGNGTQPKTFLSQTNKFIPPKRRVVKKYWLSRFFPVRQVSPEHFCLTDIKKLAENPHYQSFAIETADFLVYADSYMKVFIGADHRGFELKEKLKTWLLSQNHEVTDCGNTAFDPLDDFPDFSFTVARNVAGDAGSFGILICGSGGGVTIAANKVKGVRCVTAGCVKDIVHNRTHDDANVLAIAANFTREEEAKKLVTTFLETPFSGEEKYKRRIAKITSYEQH